MGRPNRSVSGVWYAVAAFSLWGFLPLYWKVLQKVPALEILSHRIVWSLVFVILLLAMEKESGRTKPVFSSPKTWFVMGLSSLLIGMNWFVFIWAVNNNHIVEASLGYYINPLLSVFLGMIFLKERMDLWQTLALILAVLGVAIVTIHYGEIPWIALTLALCFGLYGLVKKIAHFDVLWAFGLETAILTPLASGYLIFKATQGTGSFGAGPLSITFFLAGAGIVTALPLIWFAESAQRVKLSTVGFAQYLSPTLTLMLGVLLYHEPFTWIHLTSFALIWMGILIYGLSQVGFLKEKTLVKIIDEKTL